MPFPETRERKLTDIDHARLTRLAAAGAAPQLHEVLDEAEVVPSGTAAAGFVTMDGKCIVRDEQLQRRQIFAVRDPADTDPASGRISVLSPAGLALIGLPVGALATWSAPGGRSVAVRIEEILFEPQAGGGDRIA